MVVRIGKLRSLSEAIRANELYRRGDSASEQWAPAPGLPPLPRCRNCGYGSSFQQNWKLLSQRNWSEKTNNAAALYWYKLAYRAGDRSVANNIGCILRDRGNFPRH